jgi:hypothetical protein
MRNLYLPEETPETAGPRHVAASDPVGLLLRQLYQKETSRMNPRKPGRYIPNGTSIVPAKAPAVIAIESSVLIAGDKCEFGTAIRDVPRSDCVGPRAKRQELVGSNTLENSVAAIADIILEGYGNLDAPPAVTRSAP